MKFETWLIVAAVVIVAYVVGYEQGTRYGKRQTQQLTYDVLTAIEDAKPFVAHTARGERLYEARRP